MTQSLSDPNLRVHRPDPLYRSVVDYVLAWMAIEQLQPGNALPTERELASSLGVSRNVLREGFRVLEERGIIVTRQGSGRFVRELPNKNAGADVAEIEQLEKASIADVLEARLVLEQEVLALACQRRTTGEAQALCRLAERHAEWKDNVDFHVAIASLSHNFMFERLVRQQMDLLGELRQRQHYEEDVAGVLIGQHRGLAAAVLERNAAVAQRLIREHLTSTRMLVAGALLTADGIGPHPGNKLNQEGFR